MSKFSVESEKKRLLEPIHSITYQVVNLNNQSDSVLETKLTQYLADYPIEELSLDRSKSGHTLTIGFDYGKSNSDYGAYKKFYEQIIKSCVEFCQLKLKPCKQPKDAKTIWQYRPLIAKDLSDIKKRKLWLQFWDFVPIFEKSNLKLPQNETDLVALIHVFDSYKHQVHLVKHNLDKKYHTLDRSRSLFAKLRGFCGDAIPAARKLITDGFATTNYEQIKIFELIRAIRPSGNENPKDYAYPYDAPTGMPGRFDSNLEAIKIINLLPIFLRGRSSESPLMMYIYFSGIHHGIYTINQNLIEAGIVDQVDPGLNSQQIKDLMGTIQRKLLIQPNKSLEPITDNPSIVAFNNGIYDRKAHKLLPFSPKYVLTAKLGTNYNSKWRAYYRAPLPFAHCQNLPSAMRQWNPRQFLNNLGNNDATRKASLDEVMLETFLTNFSHHRAIVLLGPAATGKSTFLKALTYAIGKTNVASVKLEDIDKRFAASSLVNKVADISHETSQSGFLHDSSKLKAAITGDTLNIETKFRSPRSISLNNETFLQAGNKLFRTSDDNGAIQRRFVLIGFKNTNIKAHGDPAIRDDFICRPEFSEWLVYSVIHDVKPFRKYKLTKADRKLNIKQMYRNDPIRQFIKGQLLPVFRDHHRTLKEIPKAYIYLWYRNWDKKSGLKAVAKRKFTDTLSSDLKSMYQDQIPPLVSGRATITKSDVDELIKLANEDPDNELPRNEPNALNGATRHYGICYANITSYKSRTERSLILNQNYMWSNSPIQPATKSNPPSDQNMPITNQYLTFGYYLRAKELDHMLTMKQGLKADYPKEIRHDIRLSIQSVDHMEANPDQARNIMNRLIPDLKGPKHVVQDALKHFNLPSEPFDEKPLDPFGLDK